MQIESDVEKQLSLLQKEIQSELYNDTFTTLNTLSSIGLSSESNNFWRTRSH